MTMITQPIVVGVDGSTPSDAALLFARREAAGRRLPLAIVHAWEPFNAFAGGSMLGGASMAPTAGDMAGLGAEILATARGIAAGFGPTLVHQEYLVEGPAPAVLLDASDSALLLVVGGRDRTRHAAGWLGPVPLRLAAKSRCPVVVVPSDSVPTGDIVVGVDGSALSEDALGFAFDQASRRGVRLTAVLAYAADADPSGLDTSMFTNRRESAVRQLSEVTSGWGEKFPDVDVTQLVTEAAPLNALRSASSEATLLVVGTHGRGFFMRHVIGSVSSALLRVSDCPVAVVGAEATGAHLAGPGTNVG
jgi:nucleotide-binding universal stress UspA family protein